VKILSKKTTFETKTIIEENKIEYLITTRGELLPDNKKSKAITFDFKRVDGAKLTNKEEKISDKLIDEIIKDNKEL